MNAPQAEKLDNLQQGSHEWLERRRFRIGMSTLGNVFGLNGAVYHYWLSLMEQDALSYSSKESRSWEEVRRMQRGTREEYLVRRGYEACLQQQATQSSSSSSSSSSSQVRITDGEVFVPRTTDPILNEALICSTDGRITVTHASTGDVEEERLLEIKFPQYKLYLDDSTMHGGGRHPYGVPRYYLLQMMGQMGLSGVHQCDFVTVCAATKSAAAVRVYFSELLWQWMVPRLLQFYQFWQSRTFPPENERFHWGPIPWDSVRLQVNSVPGDLIFQQYQRCRDAISHTLHLYHQSLLDCIRSYLLPTAESADTPVNSAQLEQVAHTLLHTSSSSIADLYDESGSNILHLLVNAIATAESGSSLATRQSLWSHPSHFPSWLHSFLSTTLALAANTCAKLLTECDDEGQTPLHYCCMIAHQPLLQLFIRLLPQIPAHTWNGFGLNLFYTAAMHIPVLLRVAEFPPHAIMEFLTYLVETGGVRFLINREQDAAPTAAMPLISPVFYLIHLTSATYLQQLLLAGLCEFATCLNQEGDSVLMHTLKLAQQQKQQEQQQEELMQCFHCLLRCGASAQLVNPLTGDTVLHVAVATHCCDAQLVSLLCGVYNVPVNHVNQNGETALDLCSGAETEVASTLLQYGAVYGALLL